MVYYHNRKTRKQYHSFPKPTNCHFCHPGKQTEPVSYDGKLAYVVPNRTPYDQWELRHVIDHLMVIPRRHVGSLNELDADERAEIMDIIADYESRGYEIYARSPSSVTRSQAHQHTHLLKLENKVGRGFVFWRKPYFFWRIP